MINDTITYTFSVSIVLAIIMSLILLTIVTLSSFYRSLSIYKTRKRIKNNLKNKSDIVNISGNAKVFNKTLTHPIHGDECLAYKVEVYSYKKHLSQTRWEVIDKKIIPFIIEEKHKKIKIIPERDFEINLSKNKNKNQVTIKNDKITDEKVKDRLEKSVPRLFYSDCHYEKVKVTSIYPDDEVYIIGKAKNSDSLSSDIHIGKDKNTPFRISDNKNKILSDLRKKEIKYIGSGIAAILVSIVLLIDLTNYSNIILDITQRFL